MRFKKFGKLPGRPSKLIEIALIDLAKVERSKKYTVNMEFLHEHILESSMMKSECLVCLAGAVLVKTVKIPFKADYVGFGQLRDAGIKEAPALDALDDFRVGFVHNGLERLGINFMGYGLSRSITPYDISKNQFRADMVKLMEDLKAVGL